MGQDDYEAGRNNPTAPVNIGAPGWMDFQQGQRDEAMKPYLGPAPGFGQARGHASASSGPRTKSVVFAIFLAFVAGPLGLLYATKKGALALVAVWIALPMFLIWMDVQTAAEAESVAAEQLPRLLGLLWPVLWIASVALAAFATLRYNRRTRR